MSAFPQLAIAKARDSDRSAVTPESSKYQEPILEAERRSDRAEGLLRRTPPAYPLPSSPLPTSGEKRPPGSEWSLSPLDRLCNLSMPSTPDLWMKPTPQVLSSIEKRRLIARPPSCGSPAPASASYHPLSFGKMLYLPGPQFIVCKMGMTGPTGGGGVWRCFNSFHQVMSISSDPE